MTLAGPSTTLSPQEIRVVLLVDDEPQALKWFVRLYGDEFVVLTAGGVDEALAVLRERGNEVAVLLTDYRMPQQDGVRLLATVSREYEHISRLLMSAYADKDVALAAVNQGRVEQILEKPLDEAVTRQALRDASAASRRRLRDQVLLRRRDENLRETLGFLAHEVRTPLATVGGYLHALRDRQQAPACGSAELACLALRRPGEVRTMLDAALRRTDYAQSLVTSFVRTARDAYHADEAASELASDLVKSVRDGYPFEADEAGWLSCDLAQDFTLPGQRDLLYLVLCTLVKNALLALHAAPPPLPAIRIVLDTEAGEPVMRVADNGPGIAPEVLARLTREPVTTRAEQGGHGMGLVFCRRVMQSLGGDIEVLSPPGGGVHICLYFKFREEEKHHEVSR
ncbi:hybrid sensor histidine kinase/response regulator [Hydrogenophaga sp. RWCD_12]|uniref:hybrid sensor histidine kinase/response regulator n=1 Tax=Hydrogenophaga sp. RWCD_12 TaxID=3391190 RepID=UPI0039854E56